MWRIAIVLLAALCSLGIFQSSAVLCQVPKTKDLDRQHDEIMKDFVSRTHKLALQYQQSGQYSKAKETLGLILKVAPDDAQARSLLDKMQKQELAENKKTIKISANQGWQKTGVHVLEGRPVSIEAKGDWVFVMRRTVNADGLDMPEDMKKFPLGALIGFIDAGDSSPRQETGGGKKDREGRPFLVGSQIVLDRSPVSGMLYLKIHDTEESDNQGQLTVTISGQIRDR